MDGRPSNASFIGYLSNGVAHDELFNDTAFSIRKVFGLAHFVSYWLRYIRGQVFTALYEPHDSSEFDGSEFDGGDVATAVRQTLTIIGGPPQPLTRCS